MTEMNEINIPLLRKILEYITAHPDEWRQQSWAIRSDCGTAYCAAGWAVVMAGHQIVWDNPMWPDGLYAASHITDGREIEEVARIELGLTHREAEWLFEAGNTLADLWYLARRMTHGEIDVPADLPDIPDD